MLESLINFILHIDQHLIWLSNNYGGWIYAILFLIVFCETGLVVTPFLPGDSLLFAAGGLAAIGSMSLPALLVLLAVAAILGDACNYTIGRHFGQRLFRNPNSKIFKPQYLDKTYAFYEKYGARTIVLARFVPIVRTFAPFVAGFGKMDSKRFALFNIAGGILWTTLFLGAGYLFANIPVVKNNLSLVIIAIIVISVLPILIEFVRSRRRS